MTFAVYSFLIAQKQILFFILTVILALRCGTAILAGRILCRVLVMKPRFCGKKLKYAQKGRSRHITAA